MDSNRMGRMLENEFIENININGMMYEKRMYKKYPTLSELYDTLFGNIPVGLHDSMVDVEACLECYLHLTTPPLPLIL